MRLFTPVVHFKEPTQGCFWHLGYFHQGTSCLYAKLTFLFSSLIEMNKLTCYYSLNNRMLQCCWDDAHVHMLSDCISVQYWHWHITQCKVWIDCLIPADLTTPKNKYLLIKENISKPWGGSRMPVYISSMHKMHSYLWVLCMGRSKIVQCLFYLCFVLQLRHCILVKSTH